MFFPGKVNYIFIFILSAKDLEEWYRGMSTRFGRMSKATSGQGADGEGQMDCQSVPVPVRTHRPITQQAGLQCKCRAYIFLKLEFYTLTD